MEIANVETLVRVIRDSDEETALRLLKSYGDTRATNAIESTWKRAQSLIRTINLCRKRRIQNELVEFDEFSNVITLVSFVRFFAFVEEEMKKHLPNSSAETKAVLADINDAMYNTLAEVKVDRRLLWTKD